EAPGRHHGQVPEPPKLTPFDVEKQLFYSELLLDVRASHPISKSPPNVDGHRPQATTQRGNAHGTLLPSPPPTLSSDQVNRALRKINPHKANGQDNVPGQALRACGNKLADALNSIFNLSFSLSIVPLCFKSTPIVLLSKKNPPTCMNNYRPAALTPIIMKCFERVVLTHIQSSIPDTTDPLQCAYRPNSSILYPVHPQLCHFPQGQHRAQQQLYFMRRLRKFGMSQEILSNFYSGIVESILTSYITGIYHRRVRSRAASILKDPTHPLFTILPSDGRRLRSIRTKTSRYTNSFFPSAIRLLNTK
ncbi:hypothetical protein D4764_07G0000130, partial [Takifugu flavidus]